MEKIHCLYFDDDIDDLNNYKRWIEKAWMTVNFDVEIEVKSVSKHHEVEDELKLNKYHLLISDIRVGDQDLGFTLIQSVKFDYPRLAVIALSGLGKNSRERAVVAGADEYISKDSFTMDNGLRYVGNVILSVLRKCGYEPQRADKNILKYDVDNVKLTAVVELIGQENIVNLTVGLTQKKFVKIEAHYVREGLSGAAVLYLNCYENLSPNKKIFLKTSQISKVISDELSKENLDNLPKDLIIPFESPKSTPISSGGWYGISSNYKANSETFTDWLNKELVNEQAIHAVLESIFLDPIRGLKDTYTSTFNLDDSIRPNIAYWESLLDLSRRARISQALDDMGDLARKYAVQEFNPEILINFSVSKRIQNFDQDDIGLGSRFCTSHGDMHGRNILVSKQEGYLIDLANIRKMPWASDIASLAVDILIMGWDTGIDSYEWNKMNSWISIVEVLLNDNFHEFGLDKNDPNMNTFIALNWIRKNLRNIYPISDKQVWEFCLCIGIEFLRSSYRQTVPAPKRVLGLLAAEKAIIKSADLYNQMLT